MRGRVIFFIARLMPSVLGVVTTALLTRLLAPSEYGLYALGLSIIFLLTTGTFEWLGLSLMRMAPAAKQPELFFSTVTICFFALCGLCTVVAAAVVIFGGFEDYAVFTLACLAAAFCSAWIELKQRLQMAELREHDYLITSSARGATTVILVSAAAYFYGNVPVILLAVSISALIASLTAHEPRFSVRNRQPDLAICRNLFRFGFPLSISVGLATILMSVDKWMLQGLSGVESVGLFTAATLVTQVPISSLANGIGPSAYSMAVHAVEFRSVEAARQQLLQNFSILFGIVVPAAVGIVALSDNLAHLIVGPAYWQSVVLLAPWLAAAAVVSTMRAFYFDIAFQLGHKTSPLIWTMLIAVAVNVVLDFLLIPNFGEVGAAMGSLGALFVSLIVAAIAGRHIYRLPIPFADAAKIIASALLMFLVLRQSLEFKGPLALACQIGSGMVVYLGGVLALNVLDGRSWLLERLPRFRRLFLRSR